MRFIQHHCYHVYNRGNNKQQVFEDYQDYTKFLYLLKQQITPIADLLSYCLMPNHFHLIIHANEYSVHERQFGLQFYQELSYQLSVLQSSYTKYYNKKNGTSGSMFSKKFKDRDLFFNEIEMPFKRYLSTCMHYVHQNPLRAGLVKKMEDWRFSSFAEIAGSRKATFCNVELLQQLTGFDEGFYEESYGVIEEGVRRSFREGK
jgi:putative transposase